jgi:hypothetical protein
MNRLFAQLFAGLVGTIHATVLLFLGFAVLGTLLNLNQAQPIVELIAAGPPQLPPEWRSLLVILSVALGYILLMGVLSTLIAINQNLERLARDADRRGGYDADAQPAPPQ